MKILFLAPYPRGESPSQRFRFEQYFEILIERGIEFQFQSFWSWDAWKVLYKRGHFFTKLFGLIGGFIRRFLMLLEAGRFDFVFIHRECAPVGPPVFEWILAKVLSKKIIFDFDDAIWLPNTSDENSIAAFMKWHSKTKSIIKWSSKVSSGNAYLAEFAKKYNSSVVINPTTVDTFNLHNAQRHTVVKGTETIAIGWTGTHSTLQYLDLVVPVIRRLQPEFPIKFVVIANKPPELDLENLEFVAWTREHEITDLMKLDIGLMPLTDDIWAKGKCGFKALQYMALGIPTVASSVGVNSTIIDHGVNGFLCNTEDEWHETLVRLINDSGLRMSIGKEGIKKVTEYYSVHSNTSNFLGLFS